MDNNWRVVEDDGTILLKIVDFPCDYGDFGGESMWVQVVKGDDNDGIGFLRNEPSFSSLRFGDFIAYAGGTDETKASYDGRALNAYEYAGSVERNRLTSEAQETEEVKHFNELAGEGCAVCGDEDVESASAHLWA